MSSSRYEGEEIAVQLPDESPVLTTKASRILLGILVDLSKSDASETASGEGARE